MLTQGGDRDAAGTSRHCYTCSPFPGATKNGASIAAGPDCQSGSQATAVMSASHDRRCVGSDKSARATTIFIHNGAPQALVGCQAPRNSGAKAAPSTTLRVVPLPRFAALHG